MTEKQQLPGTYEVKDWVKSIKGRKITGYIDRNPIFEVKEETPFTRENFTRDLRKVSRKIKK